VRVHGRRSRPVAKAWRRGCSEATAGRIPQAGERCRRRSDDLDEQLPRLENAQGTPLADRTQDSGNAAKRRGWWTGFDDQVVEGLGAHLAYEEDATVARTYTLPFVPALLQTEDRARAVSRDMEQRSEDEIGQLLESGRCADRP
jgi:hypothetical protein